jgi:signal transduction histidine kinase
VGRLSGREWWLAVLAFAVLHPGLVGLSGWVTDDLGRPAVAFSAGLLVALLLTTGPVGGVAAVVVRCGYVAIGGGDLRAVLVALVETLVWVAVARLIEWRADENGPVRSTRVVGEFVLIGVVAGPIAVALAGELISGVPLDLTAAVAPANGVLVLVAGLRIMILRRLPWLSPRALAAVTIGAVAYVAVVAVSVRTLTSAMLGPGALLLAYVALLGFLLGYAWYATLLAAGSLLGAFAMALVGTGVDGVAISSVVSAGAALAVGLLAATEADHRRDSANELEVLFQRAATPAAVVTVPGLVVRRVNPAMAALVRGAAPAGSRSDDPIGRTLDELLHVADRDAGSLAGLADDDGASELWFRDAEGVWHFGRLSVSRIDRARPRSDLGLVQLVDLTQVQARTAALERANEALHRLSGRVAHDLRQPLASIVAFASTIEEHVERLSPEALVDMTTRLSAAAGRAVERLEGLAEGARSAGQGPVEVDLAATLDEVLGTLELEVADRDARLDRRLDVATVTTNRGAITAILLNLVGNALKYAPDDHSPVVRVTSRPSGSGVSLVVEDDGGGIPVTQLERVFDRGARLGSGDVPGTGMGLTDSRDLAEASGGTLVAAPCVTGARFDLWFPDDGLLGGSLPAALRVLHVESDVEQARRLRSLLELDIRLEHVGDVSVPEEVLPAVRHTAPDVLLLSTLLDDRETVIRRLAEELPGVFVIDIDPADTAHAAARVSVLAREHRAATPSPEQVGLGR